MNKITLDYVKNIEVDLDNLPIDNMQALEYLRDGIFYLSDLVESREIKNNNTDSFIGENGFTPNKFTVFYLSSSNPDNNLLLCQFNWFVISCINYVRIIGLIDIMIREGWKSIDIKSNFTQIKNYCDNYVEEVVPELLFWRNKISAHPSVTDPRSNDNLGLLEFSLMNQLTFEVPHYYVGSWNWSTSGQESKAEKWSLVEVFKNKLVPRYWPK